MIVVFRRGLLVPGPPVAKIVPFQDVCFFEQLDRTVHRGDGDTRVHLDGPLIDLLNIGMIDGIRENPRDDPPLVGHPQALFHTQTFELRGHLSNVGGCRHLRV